MNAAFYEADVVSLDIGLQRQLFLRQSCEFPPLAENFTECQPCVQTMSPSLEGCTVGCMASKVFTGYCEFVTPHGTIRCNVIGICCQPEGRARAIV